MTTKQFIQMIGEAETGGLKRAQDRLEAIGDSGLAGGFYQQHWTWRRDYWPLWAWTVLRLMDEAALEQYIQAHPGRTARELADNYNLGHQAPDPAYDERCLSGLSRLGISAEELDKPVSDD